MKTAIYSLYQAKEFVRASFFVRQCLPSLSEARQLLIMVNEEGMDGFADKCRQLSPFIHVLGGEGNLGVAGGRNALIRYGLESGFDFFISCDNDILFGEDYFAKIELSYERLRRVDPRVGLVQPVLLDGRGLKGALGLANVRDWQEFGNGESLAQSVLCEPWSWFVTALGSERAVKTIYHAGVNNAWAAHFSGSRPEDASHLPWDNGHEARYGSLEPTLRSSPLLAKLMAAGDPAPVFTVAGGITAFHKDVIAESGQYNDKFNPFGYEDSEFGFRTTQLGLNNYLLCSVLAVHDPFMGISNRDLYSHATIARLRAIEIADLPANDPRRAYALGQSLFFCWPSHNAQVRDSIANGEIPQADAVASAAKFFASYVLNFLYGMFGIPGADGSPCGDHLFDRLLPAGFSGCDLKDATLELGRGTRFRALDLAIKVTEGAERRRILSVVAMNCHLEEAAAGSALITSRYFDAYLVLEEKAEHQFELRVNLQANADTLSAKVVVDFAGPMSSGFRAPPALEVLDCTRNIYDFGSFSVENIYPPPSFDKSKEWFPELDRAARGIRSRGGAFSWLVDSIVVYLSGATPSALSLAATPVQPAPGKSSIPAVSSPAIPVPPRKKRVLVFTDSRGQHKPVGQKHLIFGERLQGDARLEVDLFLCPMKWTTTLDFLEMFDDAKLASYDAIVLWTGIVDWSPRPVSSAINELYNNASAINLENTGLNTSDYSRKVVNNKKGAFDGVFGSEHMNAHFALPFETMYANERTMNMYGLEMARQSLIPRLAGIRNLIFINANRFVSGWEGDFKKGRPTNIDLTHAYSDVFSDGLANSAKIIDLRKWSDDQVKHYTCDNIHVTKAGSDYIYSEVMAAIGLPVLELMDSCVDPSEHPVNAPAPAPAASNSQLLSKGEGAFAGVANPERTMTQGRDCSTNEHAIAEFRDANRLYREWDYASALSAYVRLGKADPQLWLYRRQAVDAYLRAMELGQSCEQEDIVFVKALVGAN
ncbi:hypothetical protein ACFONC_01375 [Luteimonas soli]|uniref:Glycosyltransferase 2-like domain-containing protein n=1 Tax=Luteimonas soli TaxID=1648966 RepID=A0ABV7XHN5_9GAMM